MIQFIKLILGSISPALRQTIVKFIRSLRKDAAETPNPLDDIFVEFLFVIFDIKD